MDWQYYTLLVAGRSRTGMRYAFWQGAFVHREYLALWETLWPLGHHLATFHRLVQQVQEILYTPKRASSLVESFNSKLLDFGQILPP